MTMVLYVLTAANPVLSRLQSSAPLAKPEAIYSVGLPAGSLQRLQSQDLRTDSPDLGVAR